MIFLLTLNSKTITKTKGMDFPLLFDEIISFHLFYILNVTGIHNWSFVDFTLKCLHRVATTERPEAADKTKLLMSVVCRVHVLHVCILWIMLLMTTNKN